MSSRDSSWPGVSVVIPTWNGLSLLAAHLPSVRAALENYPGQWECLVVDDGGTDATAQELPAIFPAAIYLRRERNEGFSAAVNLGIEATIHSLVLLLNITTESLRTWRRQFAGAQAGPATPAAGKLPAVALSAQELVAEVRRLRAQFQSVTNQHDILKKAVGIFAGPSGSVSP